VNELVSMLDDGVEFPEAEARMREKHGLNDMKWKQVVAAMDKDESSQTQEPVVNEGQRDIEAFHNIKDAMAFLDKGGVIIGDDGETEMDRSEIMNYFDQGADWQQDDPLQDEPFDDYPTEHIEIALRNLLKIAEAYEDKDPEISEGIIDIILPGLERLCEAEGDDLPPVDPTMDVDTTGAEDDEDPGDDDVEDEEEDEAGDHIDKSIEALTKIMNDADDSVKDEISSTIDHLQKAKDILDDEEGEEDESPGNTEPDEEQDEGEEPYPKNPPPDVPEGPSNPTQVIDEFPKKK
jgi:hypothetical protein